MIEQGEDENYFCKRFLQKLQNKCMFQLMSLTDCK